MEHPIPAVFTSQPWCRKILERYTPVVSHIGENEPDPFFAKILHTPSTIRAAAHLQSAPDDSSQFQPREYVMLLDIGEDTIGQVGICHGGFLATVMDESLGRLLHANRLDHGASPYTVLLNLTYKSPVKAPGTILVRSEVDKVEGRKIFLKAEIQDALGIVCATANSMFVRRKESSL